jgi:hypothetical protein
MRRLIVTGSASFATGADRVDVTRPARKIRAGKRRPGDAIGVKSLLSFEGAPAMNAPPAVAAAAALNGVRQASSSSKDRSPSIAASKRATSSWRSAPP